MASAVVQLEQLKTPHAGEKREIPTMMPSLASAGLSSDTNPFEFAQTLFQGGAASSCFHSGSGRPYGLTARGAQYAEKGRRCVCG